MRLLAINFILFFVTVSSVVRAEWPMSNDPNFDISVEKPMYPSSKGPKILLDGGHHNFFIQWRFTEPFANLLKADGYQTVVDDKPFTTDYLAQFDIVVIITALPFDFTTKVEVTTETTFTEQEIRTLYEWVDKGGSLLVFSEHAPFDQAINPLLSQFGIVSSVGTIADGKHHDKSFGQSGWIVYSRENGLLNSEHPIIKGRNESEAVYKLLTFGGSSLTGEGYTNILKLSPSAKNLQHPTGVGPIGMGNSQGLAGVIGKGRVVAFGDSNGFTAMRFKLENEASISAGMNTKDYDWKNMVLNTLHWISGELPAK